MYLFLSYSFGIETINTFIHSVVPSKTIPDSRPKWAKCIAFFRPKRRNNPSRWGGTYLYGLNKGVPPWHKPLKSPTVPFKNYIHADIQCENNKSKYHEIFARRSRLFFLLQIDFDGLRFFWLVSEIASAATNNGRKNQDTGSADVKSRHSSGYRGAVFADHVLY